MGLYPTVNAPVFRINNSYQHGGEAMVNDRLSMAANSGTIYYTLNGSDPRSEGAQSNVISTTVVAESAAKRVLVPTGSISDEWRSGSAYDDSSWISGTGGVGYDTGSEYRPLFNIDLYNQMYQGNTTCYIRIPFTISTAISDISFLTFKIRYDDGFIAYINGIEVARRN